MRFGPSLFLNASLDICTALGSQRGHEASQTRPSSSSSQHNNTQFAVPRKPASAQLQVTLSSQESRSSKSSINKTHNAAVQNDDIKDMWVSKHAPISIENLGMHKTKIQALQDWMTLSYDKISRGESLFQRVLIYMGPCGAGKTAAVRVVGEHLGFNLVYI